MMWGRTDANMRAADAHYGQSWRPDDFTACCACGCDFPEVEHDDNYDAHQSKADPMVCNRCADTLGDGE